MCKRYPVQLCEGINDGTNIGEDGTVVIVGGVDVMARACVVGEVNEGDN